MIYILYNPMAVNNQGYQKASELKNIYKDQETTFLDITEVQD